ADRQERRHLRPLPGTHGGDAAGQPHRRPVPRIALRRADHGQAAARDEGRQGRRGLSRHRRAEGGDRLLHRRRRHAEPLPLPRAAAVVHQPAVAAGAHQGPAHRRSGGAHRHHRHRARRGGPLMPGFLESIRGAVGDTLFYGAVSPALKILVLLFLMVLPLITYLVLIERKVLGFMQARVGPNRVGPWGLLQPIADVMKLLVKEDTLPRQAVKWAFILGPCLVVAPAFIIFSVIPVGPPAGELCNLAWYVTDVNTGLLLIIALATIGVYGLIIGGWASNSKFSLIGGLRSAAQMISYEVPQ